MEKNKPQKNSSSDILITVVKRKTNKVGNYILGQTIGEGGFAKVKLATYMYTQQNVAIKLLDKDKIIKKQADLIRIKKEINILKQLKHKNIIQLYEIMESASVLYIVMEYCEGKELFDYIIKRKRITEREACRFFQQIINGVEYLHLQNITHRDLKPENLLLDNKKRIKISDFGLSTYSEDNELLQTSCGTPSYAPPEMLRGDEYNGRLSDIWSCGIILYTMLCGNLPCAESKEDLIYDNIISHEINYPSYLSPLSIDLMNRLLAIDPSKRPDFDEIKQHPWFNLIESQLRPGLLIGVHKIPVDENILLKVERYGFDKDKCRESIIKNRFDSFSCIYYLILKEFNKEGKQSVSDLLSEQYVNFLRNINNWLKPQEARKKKYDDYWSDDDDNFELVLPLNIIKTVPKIKDKEKDNEESIKECPALIQLESSTKTLLQKKIFSKHQDELLTEEKEANIDSNGLKLKLLKMQKDNETFLKSLNDIDNLGKKNNNIITPIANKLIKGTIFSKYLTSHGLKQDDSSELKRQFNLMQKYKSLIEIIEMTYQGIFPKKIYYSNFTSFDTFLIEEEDFVFANDFFQNKCNINFIEKIKRGIRSHHRKILSQQYYSEQKPNHFNFSLPKDDNQSRVKRKRRQIISISSYITVKQSEDRSVSSLKDSACSLDTLSIINKKKNNNNNKTLLLNQCKVSTKTSKKENISNEIIKEITKIKLSSNKESRNLKFIHQQLTTTTNNSKKQKTRKDFYIDEFILKTNYKKRIQFETPKYRPSDIERLQVKCLGSRNKDIHLNAFIKNENNFHLLNFKNPLIYQFNKKAPLTTTNNHKKSLSFQQKSDNSLSKNISTSRTENNKSESDQTKKQELNQLIIYSGIVDLECCVQINFGCIVDIIKQFFKSNRFFCIYTNNKFVCSRDKTMIEIALMKLFQTSLVYLKIKKIKGDKVLYYQITHELLSMLKL